MRTGTIVVGVDDSDGGNAAVRWAAREAERRGALLHIVHAFDWEWPSARYNIGSEFLDAAREHAGALVPWRGKYPEVAMETIVSHDRPAAALVGVSDAAQLVVVGSRGHGALAGAFLGSTGIQLLHHAHCPVLIIRTPVREGA